MWGQVFWFLWSVFFTTETCWQIFVLTGLTSTVMSIHHLCRSQDYNEHSVCHQQRGLHPSWWADAGGSGGAKEEKEEDVLPTYWSQRRLYHIHLHFRLNQSFRFYLFVENYTSIHTVIYWHGLKIKGGPTLKSVTEALTGQLSISS